MTTAKPKPEPKAHPLKCCCGRPICCSAPAKPSPCTRPKTKATSAGSITLDGSYSVVHVGLPYVSDLMTLPAAFDGAPAGGQGRTKNINSLAVRVTQSSVLKAGPNFTDLVENAARDVSDPYDSPPSLRTGELRFDISPDWNADGSICIRQDLPLPLTVLSMAVDAAVGG